MAGATAAIKVNILGDAKPLLASLAAADGGLAKFGKSATKIGGLMTAAVTLPVIGLGVAAFKAGEDFDKAYDKIRIGTGATGAALGDLEASFRNVVKEVPASFEDASTAVADLNTRLGLTGPDLELVSRQVLELTRLTGDELGPTIESTTRVMGDWGRSGADINTGLDTLYKTSQATGISVSSLSEQLVKYGAPLRQMGFDMETSAALLGKFEKEGVNAELVMGSLRIALGKMARDGEPAVETFQRVTEQIRTAGSTSEANALALELFGARAGPDMAAAIREGRFEVDELVATLGASGESILGAAKETESFGEKLTKLKNRTLVAFEPLLMRLFDGVGQFADQLGPKIEQLVGWFTSLSPTVQKVVGIIVALAAVAGPVVFVVGLLSTALSAVLSPVGLVVAAIAGLVAAFVYFYRNNEGFREWVDGVVAAVREKLAAAFEWIRTTVLPALGQAFQWISDNVFPKIAQAIEAVQPVLTDLGTFISTFVSQSIALFTRLGSYVDDIGRGIAATFRFLQPVITVVWNAISATVTAAITFVRGVIQTVTALIKGDWSGVWNGIKTILSGVWQGIVAAVTAAIGVVRVVITAGLNAVRGVFTAVWNGIRSYTSTAFNAVTGVIRGAMNTARSVVSGALSGIGSLFSGVAGTATRALSGLASAVSAPFRAAGGAIKSAWNSTIGGKGISIPDIPGLPGRGKRFEIPRLHSGGVFRSDGYEGLALLRNGERVRTPEQEAALQAQLRASNADGGQVHLHLHLEGAVIAGPDVERWLVTTVENAVARGMRMPRLKQSIAS